MKQWYTAALIITTNTVYKSSVRTQKMNKKAFFIPTPGQFEQEYLAQLLDQKGIVPQASQIDFKIEMLSQIINYKGLGSIQIFTTSLSSVLRETFSNVNENSEPIPNSLST